MPGSIRINRVPPKKGILQVQSAGGRAVSVPLEWYPKLRQATIEQRENWRLIGKGVGVHWPDLDEDLSVEGLLAI